MAETETELKFEVQPARAEALLAALAPGRPRKPRRLRSVYFDTPDQALRKAGFALRVRSDGKTLVQSVKTTGAGAVRGQWEASAAGEAPDTSFVKATPAGAALDGARLAPLFAVEVERSSIKTADGAAKVEASLDKGAVVRRRRSTPISELELELESGEKAALFAYAARLRRDFDLRPGFASKAGRGFALIDRKSGPGRRFETPRLSGAMSAGAAFNRIAMAALEQIAANAEELGAGKHPEIVHQLRVGVRRLRSALKTFAPMLADARYGAIAAELEWLSGELDGARNLDVLIAGAAARGGRGKRLTVLRRRLRSERALAYARARQAAGGERLSALLFDVLMWIEVGPWTTAAAAGAELRERALAGYAATALDKARKQVARRGRGFARLDREGRHRLRISAKRLRYAAEVFGQVFPDHPKRRKRFVAKAKSLLDCLGELNDVATAEGILAADATPAKLRRRQEKRERKLLVHAREALRYWRREPAFWPVKT